MISIQEQLDLLAQTRKNLRDVMDACTTEQLYTIPEQFNNHILWNAAHVVATMHILIYASSGTPSQIDPDMVDNFKKGTFPSQEKSEDSIERVKASLIDSLDELKKDYENSAFGTYSERMTSYGVKLASVEEAICFNNLHESMHLGQIKMLRTLVA